MRHSEIVQRKLDIQAEYDKKMAELDFDIEQLNFKLDVDNFTIHFLVTDHHNKNPFSKIHHQNWYYEITVTKNWAGADDAKLRKRDWLDLPEKVKNKIKTFYEIGDKWILSKLNLNWNSVPFNPTASFGGLLKFPEKEDE